MGIQWFAATTKMMKSILFAALVAAAYADAEPKADADAYYGYYGYARPYAYGYARPYAYGYGLGGFRYLGKRSADADADADAYYGYSAMPVLMPMVIPDILELMATVLEDTDTLARGLLMLSPPLMLMPMPTTDITAMPVPMPT